MKYKALEKLEALDGLEAIKREARQILAFVQVARKRKALGLTNERHSLHMALLGNPGTGKTTVARILGELMREAGILSNYSEDDDDDEDNVPFVEISSSDIYEKFVGASERNLVRYFNKAKGGVLFIDEAYSLGSAIDADNGVTDAVIPTLVRYLENYRDSVMVVFAGYSENMEEFFKTNPGLGSRISNKLIFEDYNIDNLMRIAEVFCKEREYVLDPEAYTLLKYALSEARKKPGFGNGRVVRNYIEKAIRNHAYRVIFNTPEETQDNREYYMTLTAEDIKAGAGKIKEPQMV